VRWIASEGGIRRRWRRSFCRWGLPHGCGNAGEGVGARDRGRRVQEHERPGHRRSAVGEQVRTFIVGDDVKETAASVRERIKGLEIPSEYEHRHARGREIGESLEYILDSVEKLVLPVDPRQAFDLLVHFFEADGVAMENCGDHHWEVECAFKRAAQLMEEAARVVPAAEVAEKIMALMAADSYGVRQILSQVLVVAIARS
jgi:hypothetical protein